MADSPPHLSRIFALTLARPQMQTAPYQPFQTLGCVPACESLQHLAMSAGGYYYDLSSNSELTALERVQPESLYRVLVSGRMLILIAALAMC